MHTFVWFKCCWRLSCSRKYRQAPWSQRTITFQLTCTGTRFLQPLPFPLGNRFFFAIFTWCLFLFIKGLWNRFVYFFTIIKVFIILLHLCFFPSTISWSQPCSGKFCISVEVILGMYTKWKNSLRVVLLRKI